MTTILPTPEQLAVIEDEELHLLALDWRKRALHGDKDAYGVAHALEVEQRRRTRASQFQALPSPEPAGPRPWWRFWQGSAERGSAGTSSEGTSSANDDPMSPT